MLKKLALYLMAALLLLLSAAGCGAPDGPGGPADLPGAQPTNTAEPTNQPTPGSPDSPDVVEPTEPVLFTDSLDRQVMLPQPLHSMIPGNQAAQSILFSLAPDKMAGWFTLPSTGGIVDMEETYRSLPVYGKGGSLDVQAVKASGAQAVLFMGSAMEAEELDNITTQTGIPAIYIDAGMDALAQAYQILGGLFGQEELAEDYVDYLELAAADFAEKGQSIPDADKKHVYIASGADGLTPLDSPILALSGALNATEKFNQPISFEDVKALTVDAIITSNEAAYAAIKSDANWNELPFVQLGFYYQCPDLLYDWLQNDAPAMQMIGAKWLGNLLYPDIFAYDMVQELKLHYDMFFHVQLTDEQAETLLANSSAKPVG